MIPAKIDACWVIRKELKEMAKIRARYFARSPVSIRRATQLMALEVLELASKLAWAG